MPSQPNIRIHETPDEIAPSILIYKNGGVIFLFVELADEFVSDIFPVAFANFDVRPPVNLHAAT